MFDLLEKDPEEHIRRCNSVIKQAPDNFMAWFMKGLGHGNLGDHEQSIKCFDIALDINPSYHKAMVWKLNSLGALLRWNDIIIVSGEALKLEPNNVNTLEIRGRAFVNLERNEEAMECFEKAIKLDKNNEEVLKGMGAALIGLGRNEEAKEILRKIGINLQL